MEAFIGVTRKVQLKHQDKNNNNNQNDYLNGDEVAQTVRVIGTGADDETQYHVNTIVDGKIKAALTFEFADVICDENGYSIASFWNDVETTSGSNHDYLESTVRNNIYESNGDKAWYGTHDEGGTLKADAEKVNETSHSNYYDKSVYDMLPTELSSVLKKPQNRLVNIKSSGSWNPEKIDDLLFLPTYREICPKGSATDVEGMNPYKYYADLNDEATEKRVKHQIKGNEGAVTAGTEVIDAQTSGAFNDAGIDSGTVGSGCMYLLCTPLKNNQSEQCAYHVYTSGTVGFGGTTGVNKLVRCIAPMFCI